MEKLASTLVFIVGVIHLLPLIGVLGAERLVGLYGVAIDDPNLIILMRHRAVLFGLIGVFLIFAAFQPVLMSFALAGGLISVVSFLWIAWSEGQYNAAVQKVFTVDLVALAALLAALALHLLARFKAG